MSAVPDLATLEQIPLFRDLPAAQLTALHGRLRHLTVPASTNLMTIEQPGDVIYIILTGTVKVHVEQMNGANVILAILGPGEVVGELSVLGQPSRSATVMTMAETRVLWLDRATLADALQTMPGLAFNLACILSRRLLLANARIQALATLDVYGRVARQLLAFAEVYGQPGANGSVVIPLHLTQSDLAEMVGASRVRVNQVLGAFRDQKLITIDRQTALTILQREGLADYCQ